MGIMDAFKGKQYKEEVEKLTKQLNQMQELLTPEMQDAMLLQQKIDDLKIQEQNQQQAVSQLYKNIEQLNNTISKLDKTIEDKKSQIVWMDDEILVQEFGLYTPKFDFASSLDYKEELAKIRSKQKELIKQGRAVSGVTNWQVNGSAAKGRKLVSDTQKLLLRAFNGECDELVSKVKYTNFDASLNKIQKSAETISKLGTVMNISICRGYLDAKIKELRLAFEYQQKKQEEKEAQRAAREELREAARLQKEIEAQRKKIEKEQTHYLTAYHKISVQLQANPNDENLIAKKAEIEQQLGEIEKSIKDIDYREANQKAGYVYVISNIGAFGKDIYKIGMTRRLDPQDRIDELGSASVPFNFDVHAMIFSDNAPALEAALHRAFEDKKLNMVNHRREFFHVTLDEIKDVVRKNFDKTVEFTDVPDAEQYRISLKLRAEQPQEQLDRTIDFFTPNSSPSVKQKNSPAKSPIDPKKVLRTRWGNYEMPDPYSIKLTYGARTDLKKIEN